MNQFDWPCLQAKAAYEHGEYVSGSTEPWIAQVVAALVQASEAKEVLELGSYLGYTTAWLAKALEKNGFGHLDAVEMDEDRAASTTRLIKDLRPEGVAWTVHCEDSLEFLVKQPENTYDFCWLDDDHKPLHVKQELDLLLGRNARMRKGGIVCMHDVTPGTLGLDSVCKEYGGLPLDLPRLGPSGGIGIIQRSYQ